MAGRPVLKVNILLRTASCYLSLNLVQHKNNQQWFLKYFQIELLLIVWCKNRFDDFGGCALQCVRHVSVTCCKGSSEAEPGCSHSYLKVCDTHRQEEVQDTAAHL